MYKLLFHNTPCLLVRQLEDTSTNEPHSYKNIAPYNAIIRHILRASRNTMKLIPQLLDNVQIWKCTDSLFSRKPVHLKCSDTEYPNNFVYEEVFY